MIKEFNEPYSERVSGLIKEASEILKIIVASIITTRERVNKNTNS